MRKKLHESVVTICVASEPDYYNQLKKKGQKEKKIKSFSDFHQHLTTKQTRTVKWTSRITGFPLFLRFGSVWFMLVLQKC